MLLSFVADSPPQLTDNRDEESDTFLDENGAAQAIDSDATEIYDEADLMPRRSRKRNRKPKNSSGRVMFIRRNVRQASHTTIGLELCAPVV